MRLLSTLPRSRTVAFTALALAALGGGAGVFFLDRQVEREFSDLQGYTAGDIVDRMTLLDRDQGVTGLMQSVTRATETAAPGQVFLLVDATGRKLAGNLPAWPREIDEDDDWQPFTLPDGTAARAISATMPDKARLLVGATDASRRAVRRDIVLSAALSFGVLILALLGVAAAWGWLVGRELDRLSRAARAIARGARETRLTERAGRDGFVDVTHAFNQMVDENHRLVSGLQVVTQSLAHDLRTPLMRMHAAIGDARAAAAAGSADATGAALDRAEREAGRTVEIFSGLADLALAESGLSREAMEPTALGELVRDVAELFEPLAADRGQTLQVQVEPLTLRAHRQLLFQAIGNLLANAIRHGPAGSKIELRLAGARSGAVVSIRDHGAGLTEAEAAEALRPFVRLEADGPGLGLGLAIAEAVAHLHGGTLRLRPAAPGLKVELWLWTEDGQDRAQPVT